MSKNNLMKSERRGGLTTILVMLVVVGLSTLFASPATAASYVLDDFTSGTVVDDHPSTNGLYKVWYDVTDDADSLPLDGSFSSTNPCLQMREDGTTLGYTNGAYIIYENAVPADGEYYMTVTMDVIEQVGFQDCFDQYQMGVAVGIDAQHRGENPSKLPAMTIFCNYPGALTTGGDVGNPTEFDIPTNTFNATAGDDILVAFSTDVQSGDWNLYSREWGPNVRMRIDDITLVEVLSSAKNWELYNF